MQIVHPEEEANLKAYEVSHSIETETKKSSYQAQDWKKYHKKS